MQTADLTTGVQMGPDYVWRLAILATTGLVLMWGIFVVAVWFKNESITDIVVHPAFLRTVTVMGIIAGTVVLSLADKIPGSLTAAILSGIVGYVLGTTAKPKANLASTEPDKKKP